MLFELVGCRESSFVTKDTGERISGVNFYVLTEIEGKNSFGKEASHFFLSSSKFDNLLKQAQELAPCVCLEDFLADFNINAEYNRYGKLCNFKPVLK